MIARFGPYSPGRQATVRSPGQLDSSMSSASLAPVVKTTSAAAQPGQRADGRTARIEDRRGGLGGDVSADLSLVPGMLGRGVDDGEALP